MLCGKSKMIQHGVSRYRMASDSYSRKVLNAMEAQSFSPFRVKVEDTSALCCTFLAVSTADLRRCQISYFLKKRKHVPAGIRTQDLLNTSQTLLPLSHRDSGIGVEDIWHIYP